MFRIASSLRTVCASAARLTVSRPTSVVFVSRRTFHMTFPRSFAVDPAAAPAALQVNEVTERVLNVLKKFEKVKNPEAVTATANFASDLGLDSLDAVEVVMQFEDEFGIEIPDADADKILSTADAIKYIAAHPKAQ